METLQAYGIIDLFILFLLMLFWFTMVVRIWQRLYYTAAVNGIAIVMLTVIMFNQGPIDYPFLVLLIGNAIFTYLVAGRVMRKELNHEEPPHE